jgi:HPt (histidine-containing phosphotransfer) domain-containing protein
MSNHAGRPIGAFDVIARVHSWGGEQLVAELTAIFREEVPRRMQFARAATRSGEASALEHAAHSLKSSCGQLGAARMHAICDEVETRAATGSIEGAAALLDLLEHEFVTFNNWLDQAAKAVRSASVATHDAPQA